jgi:hypothetical protein
MSRPEFLLSLGYDQGCFELRFTHAELTRTGPNARASRPILQRAFHIATQLGLNPMERKAGGGDAFPQNELCH